MLKGRIKEREIDHLVESKLVDNTWKHRNQRFRVRLARGRSVDLCLLVG